ncbi:hypothetical protein L611_001200000650 [Aminobacter sp. J15]|nr:hypothetical protein L611_001200000650 [Aminobacter sp. J15]
MAEDNTPVSLEVLPHVSHELVEFLKEKYPLAGFMNVENERQLWLYKGAVEVVQFLEGVHKAQINR